MTCLLFLEQELRQEGKTELKDADVAACQRLNENF